MKIGLVDKLENLRDFKEAVSPVILNEDKAASTDQILDQCNHSLYVGRGFFASYLELERIPLSTPNVKSGKHRQRLHDVLVKVLPLRIGIDGDVVRMVHRLDDSQTSLDALDGSVVRAVEDLCKICLVLSAVNCGPSPIGVIPSFGLQNIEKLTNMTMEAFASAILSAGCCDHRKSMARKSSLSGAKNCSASYRRRSSLVQVVDVHQVA